MLIQLPDESWIDPSEVVFIGANDAAEFGRVTILPVMFVKLRSGDQRSCELATLEDAKRMCNELAAKVNSAKEQANEST